MDATAPVAFSSMGITISSFPVSLFKHFRPVPPRSRAALVSSAMSSAVVNFPLMLSLIDPNPRLSKIVSLVVVPLAKKRKSN
jgi:hypothetical protein